ncbi:hypothetical protein VKT23_002452 [Stygiomarasmius scandens]|uniref:Uncharacterized protein n=1 Tax=Marasmiellus scandens TaxID=2682957 RepID=A0ABR1K3D6_9AGAR
MIPDTLEQVLDITRSKNLKLKSDIAERTQKSILLGQDQYMSSDNMYRHLNMLENLVPKTSDASARLWIDTLLFRSSTMVPAGKSMILNLEYGALALTSSTKLSGCIDYTAILIDNEDFDVVFTSASILNIKQQLPTGFFVIEVKPDGRFLDDHIPQAIAEMYGCARIMQKDIIRGALTNGLD